MSVFAELEHFYPRAPDENFERFHLFCSNDKMTNQNAATSIMTQNTAPIRTVGAALSRARARRASLGPILGPIIILKSALE